MQKCERELVYQLALSLAERGTDAFGYWNGKSLFKAPVSSIAFFQIACRFNLWRKVFPKKSSVFLMHTRMATQGDPADNRNNHPLAGKKWIIAHNGVIWYPPISYDRVDSLAILEALEKGETIEDSFANLEEIDGSMSIWCLHRESGRIFIYTNNGQINVMKLRDGVMFYSPVWRGKPIKRHVVYEVLPSGLKPIQKVETDMVFCYYPRYNYAISELEEMGVTLAYDDKYLYVMNAPSIYYACRLPTRFKTSEAYKVAQKLKKALRSRR